MLRIHFTEEDLARTRLIENPEVMWEILLSLHKLGDRDGGRVFDGWRRRVRGRLAAGSQWLIGMAPSRGYSPDFLTPTAGGTDIEQGIEYVLSTPRRRLRTDLERLADQRRLGERTIALARGQRDALHDLGLAIRGYYRAALAPYWAQVRDHIHADIVIRSRALVRNGAGEVLCGLNPRARWRQSLLELPYSTDQDLYLGGRGLLLVPSFFCWGGPISLMDPALTPVLVYPIEHDLNWLSAERPRPNMRELATLLGRTRATILVTVAAECCSTSELAERACVSIASASQHASVLRQAGLITTRRRGSCVVHSVTHLGATLIVGHA